MTRPDVQTDPGIRRPSPVTSRERDRCVKMAKHTCDIADFKVPEAAPPRCERQLEPLSELPKEISNARIINNPPPNAV